MRGDENEVLPVDDYHPFFCEKHNQRNKSKAKGKAKSKGGHARHRQSSSMYGDDQWRCEYTFDRDSLLRPSSHLRHTYTPQLGDKVVYFPQGHEGVLRDRAAAVAPPWNAFPEQWSMVLCEVISLEYEFPTHEQVEAMRLQKPPIFCRLQLRVIGMPSPMRNGAKLFESPDEAAARQGARTRHHRARLSAIEFPVDYAYAQSHEYLVPQAKVEAAWHHLDSRFKPAMVVKWTDEVTAEVYDYIVLDVEDADASWPESLWNCVKIQYQQDAPERMSPWELDVGIDDASSGAGIVHLLGHC